MASKRSREQHISQPNAKRTKVSPSSDYEQQPLFKQATPSSRSETPAETTTSKMEFTVVYLTDPASKKKSNKDKLAPSRLWEKREFQESPFKAKGEKVVGEMDQHFTVVPTQEWSAMKKYNNFIIQGDVYKNDTIVYVRNPTTKITDKDNEHNFWVARILQVRAENAQNVYALIAWMYWPEELPGFKSRLSGAQSYHGKKNELVASNYMEVLDVLSFAGKADVSQYLEEDDAIPTRLYWRQTFCRQTQELSKLKERCTCRGHFNPDPDQQMFICDNSQCGTWLHKHCLVDSALQSTYERLMGPIKAGTKKKGTKKPYAEKFTGKVLEADTPKVMIEITDLRAGKSKEKWTEQASCLQCNTPLLR